MPVLSRRKRILPCILTEEEISSRQDELVTQTKSRELREDSLKAWKAVKADEQKSYEADISHVARECFRLAGIIESGSEPREVECEEILSQSGVEVTTFRLDTGEVVGVRVASADELQRRLDFEESKRAAGLGSEIDEAINDALPQCLCAGGEDAAVKDPACPVHGVERNIDGTAKDSSERKEDPSGDDEAA